MTDQTNARAAALEAVTAKCETIITQYITLGRPNPEAKIYWADGGKLNEAMRAEVNAAFDAKEA